MKAFQNFVNGNHVDAADGRTSAVVNPATGEQYATAPISGDADVDAAMQAAAAAFEVWRDATPSERSLALFRIADAVEARADDLIALEVENCGKPAHLVRSEEIPPMVDQIRFFATAARHLEGKSAAEYMQRHDVVHPPRARRRVRPGRALELPDDDGGVEVRAGALPRATRWC